MSYKYWISLFIVMLASVVILITSAKSWAAELISNGYYNSIAVDSNGNPQVVYDNTYAHRDPVTGNWLSETVDQSNGFSEGNAIVVGPQNSTFIAYESGWDTASLMFAKRTSGSWQSTQIGSGSLIQKPSMALSDSDNIWISWGNFPWYNNTSRELMCSHFDGISWTNMVVDIESWRAGFCNSIAINPISGTPAISYSLENGGSADKIKYASWNGSSWNLETIDTNAVQSSLKFDHQGNPNVLYATVANTLKYATRQNGSWSSEILPFDIANSRSPVWLDLDSQDKPHILFASTKDGAFQTYGYDLNYAYLSGDVWTCVPIVQASVGLDPNNFDMVLDAYDNALISYHENDGPQGTGLFYVNVLAVPEPNTLCLLAFAVITIAGIVSRKSIMRVMSVKDLSI